MKRDRVLDAIAVTFALTCVVVVLHTLVQCLPQGRWAVDANSANEMYIELVLVALATPFTGWRLLRIVFLKHR